MHCDKCGKPIGTEDEAAYQVRVGHVDDEGNFVADQAVDYYCSDCLAGGV